MRMELEVITQEDEEGELACARALTYAQASPGLD